MYNCICVPLKSQLRREFIRSKIKPVLLRLLMLLLLKLKRVISEDIRPVSTTYIIYTPNAVQPAISETLQISDDVLVK